jgi:hypothetical protein
MDFRSAFILAYSLLRASKSITPLAAKGKL